MRGVGEIGRWAYLDLKLMLVVRIDQERHTARQLHLVQRELLAGDALLAQLELLSGQHQHARLAAAAAHAR
eukprot:scaffold210387_cov26-Tisochrysis_lutea.AAC.1